MDHRACAKSMKLVVTKMAAKGESDAGDVVAATMRGGWDGMQVLQGSFFAHAEARE